MKCPNCGAELTGDVCEYCGTHAPREKVKMNRSACPKCGSEHVSYTLQRNTWYTQETVGICKDCGYSWSKGGNNGFVSFGPETMLWLAGWLLCFPIPLTILILRAKSIPPVARYILIAVLWLLSGGIYFYPILDAFFFF